MAGKKGSIMKFTEDEPLNFLGLFNSENVDKGVKWGTAANIGDGGHVIQHAQAVGLELARAKDPSLSLLRLSPRAPPGSHGHTIGTDQATSQLVTNAGEEACLARTARR
jgi:hypothetical protein